MTLLTRINRLFKADVHGILDSLEDPEAILKQSIREMQVAIDHGQNQYQNLNSRRDQSVTVLSKLKTDAEGFKPQLDLAFADSNEALIKSLLRKKLATEIQIDLSEVEIQTLNEQITSQQTELDEHQEKLNTINQKLALFSQQAPLNSVAQGSDLLAQHNQHIVSEDDIELAYLQEKQRRAQASTTNHLTE